MQVFMNLGLVGLKSKARGWRETLLFSHGTHQNCLVIRIFFGYFQQGRERDRDPKRGGGGNIKKMLVKKEKNKIDRNLPKIQDDWRPHKKKKKKL